MRAAALILAAGFGLRLGHDRPKALVAVQGQPIVARSAATFAAHPGIAELVVVAPAAELAEVRRLATANAQVVAGGATRQESVRAGLAALDPGIEAVLIHDSARAFAPTAVIDRVLAALADGAPAVIPVLPMVDAVKQVDADGAVVATLDRSALRIVQTPQGFARAVIDAAHARAQAERRQDAVDDAALVEALGQPVRTVEGDPLAFKITVPADLARAQLLNPAVQDA